MENIETTNITKEDTPNPTWDALTSYLPAYDTIKKVVSASVWDAATIDIPTCFLTAIAIGLSASNPVGLGALGVIVGQNILIGTGADTLGYVIRKGTNEAADYAFNNKYISENTKLYLNVGGGLIGNGLKYGLKGSAILIGAINGAYYEFSKEKINKNVKESNYANLGGNVFYIEGVQEELILKGLYNLIYPPAPNYVLNWGQKIIAITVPAAIITTSINVQEEGYKSVPVKFAEGMYELFASPWNSTEIQPSINDTQYTEL